MKQLMTTDIFNHIATASPFYDDHHNDDKMTKFLLLIEEKIENVFLFLNVPICYLSCHSSQCDHHQDGCRAFSIK